MLNAKIFFGAKWLFTVVLITGFIAVYSQPPVAAYRLYIHYVGKDTSFNPANLQLKTTFSSLAECTIYVAEIPQLLTTKGYPTASVDSIWQTGSSQTDIFLFVGKQYRWGKLLPVGIEQKALDEAGFIQKQFQGKFPNVLQIQKIQSRLLDYYENNGYPFAEVFLDSVQIVGDEMHALLKVKKGILYHVDSIRVFGKAKIAQNFLHHYLEIENGSLFNKKKLQAVSLKLQELPYLQEMQPNVITMLGAGSLLDLYLAPKRSSQINFLVGVLPANSQTGKLQFTGDVNLNLNNALSVGENILLNWQQLQVQSPRLNLGYRQPYVFNSSFGIDFSFGLFKKDSTFLQLNAQAGLQYIVSPRQSWKLFLQWQNSFLLANGVDTNLVIATKMLPPNSDYKNVNVGFEYEWSNTNYKLNPRHGTELKATTAVGLKNTRKNNTVLSIKNNSFNYPGLYDSIKLKSYQLRLQVGAARYFPIARQAAFKLAINGGYLSSQAIFRNELFQIGGYALLRGFDEQSIYATQYAVATAEYRYLLAQNSYLFVFSDGGLVQGKYQNINNKNQFISAGLGMVFETKFGILNISYALGKRNDVEFNIRQSSKIHFGYINYF